MVAGVELLPSADTVRPLLFVGNHSRMGVYDLPWILSELYMRGIKAAPLLPVPACPPSAARPGAPGFMQLATTAARMMHSPAPAG